MGSHDTNTIKKKKKKEDLAILVNNGVGNKREFKGMCSVITLPL